MKTRCIYRLATGERLEEREARWPANLRQALIDGRLELVDGEPLEPGVFVLLDAEGAVSATYPEPTEHTADDSVYFSGVHFVREGRLYEATIEWNPRRDGGRCRLVAHHVARESLEPIVP